MIHQQNERHTVCKETSKAQQLAQEEDKMILQKEVMLNLFPVDLKHGGLPGDLLPSTMPNPEFSWSRLKLNEFLKAPYSRHHSSGRLCIHNVLVF